MAADSSTRRVVLHVGAPKTGTTFLQDVLWHHRRRLARDGVRYPGRRDRDHFLAAQDLRGLPFLGHTDPAATGGWDRIAGDVRSWAGPVSVVSHELLAWADEEQVARALSSLASAEVHVVYTARDLGRQIPAVWQESVKNRRGVPYGRYLRILSRRPERPAGRVFWGAQDAADVLRRWGGGLPPERVHVVTVPPSGGPPGLLWQRFAGLLGVDPGRYDPNVARPNVSLGLAEAELLRRVNAELGEALDWPTYDALVKRGLVETVLTHDPAPIAIPARHRPWVIERSTEMVAELAAAGYDVVGDLEELVPAFAAGGGGRGAARVDDQEVLAAAVRTVVALLTERVSTHRWQRLSAAISRRRASSAAAESGDPSLG